MLYSFEISSQNIQRMQNVLKQNPEHAQNVCIVHLGSPHKPGKERLVHSGSEAKIEVGDVEFLKGDVEGHGFAMVKGAEKDAARAEPIVTVSCYLDFWEMYNVSVFLTNLLPNYHFEWHLESDIDWAFF
jgi:hypothetical protein